MEESSSSRLSPLFLKQVHHFTWVPCCSVSSESLRLPRKSAREESGAPPLTAHPQVPCLRICLLPGLSTPAPATEFCSVLSQSPSVSIYPCLRPSLVPGTARHTLHLLSFLSCLLCVFSLIFLQTERQEGGRLTGLHRQLWAFGHLLPVTSQLVAPCPHPSPLPPPAFQPFLLLPQRPPRSGPPGNAIALPG